MKCVGRLGSLSILQFALRRKTNAYTDIRNVFEVVTDFNYLDNNNIRSLAQRATDMHVQCRSAVCCFFSR